MQSSTTSTSLLAILFLFTICCHSDVSAHKPEDPVVQSMVARGIRYLESLPGGAAGKGAIHGGAEFYAVVVAYAHYKAQHNVDSPVVKRGITIATGYADKIAADRGSSAEGSHNKSTYQLSVCILLLCEVGSEKYRSKIETLRDMLFSLQKPDGGFGYPGDVGDTSQTQYIILASWVMDHSGISVREDVVARAQLWFMRVQDPSGAWPYRGVPGGSGLVRQNPSGMSHSTSLAGGSSLLIAGDFFRMWRLATSTEGLPAGMPKAVAVAAEEGDLEKRRSAAKVKPEAILAAVNRMKAYRGSSPYKRGDAANSTWHYYMMYSMERFESFREFAESANEAEPQWFNEGVDELRKNQDVSGAWGVKDKCYETPPLATAFAILFLVRSTKKAIAEASSGSLAGGWQLPKDTTQIRVEGTQIKGKPVAEAVTDLLDMLEDDGADDMDSKSLPDNLQLATEPADRAAQLDRLERLVRGSNSWQARRVAARLLGQSDELRVVPSLIFALTDPDSSVKRYARDGLRFISRNFEGYGMPDKPNAAQIRQAQSDWRAWYRKLDPNYIFLDYDL